MSKGLTAQQLDRLLTKIQQESDFAYDKSIGRDRVRYGDQDWMYLLRGRFQALEDVVKWVESLTKEKYRRKIFDDTGK